MHSDYCLMFGWPVMAEIKNDTTNAFSLFHSRTKTLPPFSIPLIDDANFRNTL